MHAIHCCFFWRLVSMPFIILACRLYYSREAPFLVLVIIFVMDILQPSVAFLALLHFIFLAAGFYGLIFGPFLGHWSLLISSLFLAVSVYTFLWLRNLFCRIFLHKEGILLVYLDGRVINLGFSDLKEIKSKKRFSDRYICIRNRAC